MIANFVLFQVGWFASVLGAAQGVPWLGVVGVGAVVTAHLVTMGTPGEGALVAVAAGVGVLVDTVLLDTGLVTYRSQWPFAVLAPAWIVAMWANFAITLRHSLAWLRDRAALAAVLGAVFGPLAYLGAARLGAVELSSPTLSLAALAIAWASALPGLLWISARLGVSNKY